MSLTSEVSLRPIVLLVLKFLWCGDNIISKKNYVLLVYIIGFAPNRTLSVHLEDDKEREMHIFYSNHASLKNLLKKSV